MEKRDKIITAAIRVFQKLGIEKTKVSDIVKEAGIAQGTFYLYFPSKLSVMPFIAEKTVIKIVSQVKLTVNENAPLEDQLIQIIDCVFKLNKKYHDIFAFLYTGITQTDAHLKEWESIYEPFYTWMRAFLSNHKENGQISPSIDIEITSKLLIGLIESAAEQVYLFDNAKEEEIARQKNGLLTFVKNALCINRR